MASYLTLDLGTTFVKAAMFDEGGRMRHVVRRPLPIRQPQTGRYELDAGEFVVLIRALVSQLRASCSGLGAVAATSFATQANSFALFGDGDRPRTPFILWPDERAAGLSSRGSDLVRGLPLAQVTGVPAISHQFAPAKLMWLRENQPQTVSQARRLCFLSDYLTLWMTGQHVCDASSAALSALVDVHRVEPWADTLQCFEVRPQWIGRIVHCGTRLGPIRAAAADALGLPRTCVYVVGCLDQYAGAIGSGVVTPASLCETTGTVLATVRCSRQFNRVPPSQVFQGPSYDPGLYFQMVFGSMSANLLEAYRQTLTPTPSYAELDALAQAVEPGADGLQLAASAVPEKPHDLFTGQRSRHTAGHCVRAILEGVAMALRKQVQQLYGSAEFPECIRCAGGAARSRLWRTIKAAVLGRPMVAGNCSEPTSLGAAILAAAAVTGEPAACVAARWVQGGETTLPDPRLCRRYAELFPP